MDDLYDYILWLGGYSFSNVPFQDADAVILCLISYFDLSPLFEGADEVKLSAYRKQIDAGEVRFESMCDLESSLRILKAAVASRRFGDLSMTGYVDILLTRPPIQFSAVTFHSDAGWSFIAYRGTDNSLAGWREDFMISFTPTQAQEFSEEYARNRITPDRAWFIGGHSKGGNLALYAACKLSKEKRTSLRHVYVLDGPGFCPEVLDVGAIGAIEPLITRIIPGFSVIGRLFEPRIRATRIVRSSASGLMQHDPASWCIDHGKLATLPQTLQSSNLIIEILNKWIGNLAREDRRIFVNDVFDVLAAGGAKTLEALSAEGLLKGYEAMRLRLKSTSEITRRVLRNLSRQTLQSILDALFRKEEDE